MSLVLFLVSLKHLGIQITSQFWRYRVSPFELLVILFILEHFGEYSPLSGLLGQTSMLMPIFANSVESPRQWRNHTNCEDNGDALFGIMFRWICITETCDHHRHTRLPNHNINKLFSICLTPCLPLFLSLYALTLLGPPHPTTAFSCSQAHLLILLSNRTFLAQSAPSEGASYSADGHTTPHRDFNIRPRDDEYRYQSY